jgi:GT2 family glycosyltransferase
MNDAGEAAGATAAREATRRLPAARPDAGRAAVSVVIVNWNGGADLAECVTALRSAGGRVAEIVVVDNGSEDDSLERLGRPPAVSVVRAGRNLGFAAGVNLGARRCSAPLLLLLNPDVRVLPGAIDAAADYLDHHPGVGIVGPVLVDGGGRWQPSAGHLGVLGHLFLDSRLARRAPRRSRHVDWVHGAFLLMPRVLFEALDGLDDAYFMYGEDMDLCARARAAGYRTALVASARVIHFGNRSGAVRWGDTREAEVVKGEMRYYAWSGGPWSLTLFRVLGTLKLSLKAGLQGVAGERAAARRTWAAARACASFRPEPNRRDHPV